MAFKRNRASRHALIRAISVAIALTAVMTCTSYAWFLGNKMSRTGGMQVDIPPIIYINDENREEMRTFDLDGLQIGIEYVEVFCVSPIYQNAVKNFSLGVIYTENIGMQIEIYPVTAIGSAAATGEETIQRTLSGNVNCNFNYQMAWPAVASNENAESLKHEVTYGGWAGLGGSPDPTYLAGQLNRGVYKLYSGFRFESPNPATAPGPNAGPIEVMQDMSSYRFFVLRVTWDPNLSEPELEREVDIVYIVAKGTPEE